MIEPDPAVASGAPPAPPKKSNNALAVVIAVVIVLCCGCFGALGLIIAFWQPILSELGLG